MPWRCLMVVLFLGAGSLVAETVKIDALKVGAITYSNLTVLGANATDLYFTHDRGIANVKLKYLSPALQKRFNYDPVIAAETERQRAEDDARYQSSLFASVAATARAAVETNLNVEALADPISPKSLLGKRAPSLEVEKWLGNAPESEGKYVIISFWAPSSAPCRKWIPALNELQKEFAGGLQVVGLSSEPEEVVTNLIEPKLEFVSGVDTQARLSKAAGVDSIPTVLLLDPKGIVRYQGHPAALTPDVLQHFLPLGPARPNAKTPSPPYGNNPTRPGL